MAEDDSTNPERKAQLVRAVIEAAQKKLRGEPIDDPLLNGMLDLLVAQSRQTDPTLSEQQLLENIARIPTDDLPKLLEMLAKKRG